MKKFVSMALALTVAASMAVPAFAALQVKRESSLSY